MRGVYLFDEPETDAALRAFVSHVDYTGEMGHPRQTLLPRLIARRVQIPAQPWQLRIANYCKNGPWVKAEMHLMRLLPGSGTSCQRGARRVQSKGTSLCGGLP